MKFTIEGDTLLKYSSIADLIIKNVKSPLAILLNIYIEALEDGTIILMSYNGESGIKLELKANVEETGKITVLSRKLLEILRKLLGKKVVVRTSELSENEVFIHEENVENPVFYLNGIPADAYPVFYEFNWENYITINPLISKELIEYTIFAVSQTSTKPAFTGIYIEEPVDGMLSFVSTDGKRLAFATRKYNEKKGIVNTGVILPENVIRTLHSALDPDNEVFFSVTMNQAFFKISNIYLCSNLIEGKFPNYKDVIPKNKINSGVIEGEKFLEALETVAVMSDPDTGKTKLELTGGKMVLSAQHSVYGIAREELKPIEYSGSEISVYLNYKHLLDFLKVARGRNIEFTINSQSSPMVFKIIGDDDYTYIDMPLRSIED
jgi:DNA polymerase-3 subunit beta